MIKRKQKQIKKTTKIYILTIFLKNSRHTNVANIYVCWFLINGY